MNKYLRMNRFIMLLMLALFPLAACAPVEQTPVSEDSTLEAEAQPTEAAITEAVPAEVPSTDAVPTETAASESGGGVSAAGVQMECTLVSDQPDVPAELVAIFGITEDDWVKGPETAAVTFVEYSDFQ